MAVAVVLLAAVVGMLANGPSTIPTPRPSQASPQADGNQTGEFEGQFGDQVGADNETDVFGTRGGTALVPKASVCFRC